MGGCLWHIAKIIDLIKGFLNHPLIIGSHNHVQWWEAFGKEKKRKENFLNLTQSLVYVTLAILTARLI